MAERKRWSRGILLFITVFLVLVGSISYMVWTLGQDMQTELEEMIGLVYREDPDAAMICVIITVTPTTTRSGDRRRCLRP